LVSTEVLDESDVDPLLPPTSEPVSVEEGAGSAVESKVADPASDPDED
jgi:hypothetical protein